MRHAFPVSSAGRSPAPQRWQNRCCHPLPTDALMDLIIRRRLGRLVPIWRNVDTTAHLPICASAPSHSGGPRAGVIRGGSESTPIWFGIWRMSAPCVMKAVTRICPPQMEHSSGNTSQMRAINTAHRQYAGRLGGVGWAGSTRVENALPAPSAPTSVPMSTPVLVESARTCASCTAAPRASAPAAAAQGQRGRALPSYARGAEESAKARGARNVKLNVAAGDGVTELSLCREGDRRSDFRINLRCSGAPQEGASPPPR